MPAPLMSELLSCPLFLRTPQGSDRVESWPDWKPAVCYQEMTIWKRRDRLFLPILNQFVFQYNEYLAFTLQVMKSRFVYEKRYFRVSKSYIFKTQPGPIVKNATIEPSAENRTHKKANLVQCCANSAMKDIAESLATVFIMAVMPVRWWVYSTNIWHSHSISSNEYYTWGRKFSSVRIFPL